MINLDTFELSKVTNIEYNDTFKTNAKILNSDLFTYGKCYSTIHKHETANLKNPIKKIFIILFLLIIRL